MESITCGVPQGSILGPLLFLIFVNDLSRATSLDPIMFADETNLFYSSKNMSYFINKETDMPLFRPIPEFRIPEVLLRFFPE